MLKIVLAFVVTLSAGLVKAQTCATNTDQLRDLVAHADVPLRWVETSERNSNRVLSMTITNGAAGPIVRLTLPDGRLWANLSGQICQAGSDRRLVMQVNKRASAFGPGAPGLVRTFGGVPNTVSLNLSADFSTLQVRASSYRGSFRPH